MKLWHPVSWIPDILGTRMFIWAFLQKNGPEIRPWNYDRSIINIINYWCNYVNSLKIFFITRNYIGLDKSSKETELHHKNNGSV